MNFLRARLTAFGASVNGAFRQTVNRLRSLNITNVRQGSNPQTNQFNADSPSSDVSRQDADRPSSQSSPQQNTGDRANANSNDHINSTERNQPYLRPELRHGLTGLRRVPPIISRGTVHSALEDALFSDPSNQNNQNSRVDAPATSIVRLRPRQTPAHQSSQLRQPLAQERTILPGTILNNIRQAGLIPSDERINELTVEEILALDVRQIDFQSCYFHSRRLMKFGLDILNQQAPLTDAQKILLVQIQSFLENVMRINPLGLAHNIFTEFKEKFSARIQSEYSMNQSPAQQMTRPRVILPHERVRLGKVRIPAAFQQSEPLKKLSVEEILNADLESMVTTNSIANLQSYSNQLLQSAHSLFEQQATLTSAQQELLIRIESYLEALIKRQPFAVNSQNYDKFKQKLITTMPQSHQVPINFGDQGAVGGAVGGSTMFDLRNPIVGSRGRLCNTCPEDTLSFIEHHLFGTSHTFDYSQFDDIHDLQIDIISLLNLRAMQNQTQETSHAVTNPTENQILDLFRSLNPNHIYIMRSGYTSVETAGHNSVVYFDPATRSWMQFNSHTSSEALVTRATGPFIQLTDFSRSLACPTPQGGREYAVSLVNVSNTSQRELDIIRECIKRTRRDGNVEAHFDTAMCDIIAHLNSSDT